MGFWELIYFRWTQHHLQSCVKYQMGRSKFDEVSCTLRGKNIKEEEGANKPQQPLSKHSGHSSRTNQLPMSCNFYRYRYYHLVETMNTVTRKNIAGVLILRSLRLPLVRKINTREFSILRRTADPQKQVTLCFMTWRLNITHSRHPKRVYIAVCVITDRYLSDKIANTCEYYFNSAY